MDYDTAKADFHRVCAAPTAVLDNGGPTEKLRRRVLVRVKDRVTFRDATIHAKILQAKDLEMKKATKGDLDRLTLQVEKSGYKSLEDADMATSAMQAVQARSAASKQDQTDGQYQFGEGFKDAALIGDFQDYMEVAKGKEEKANEDGASWAGDEMEDAASANSKISPKKATVWLDKEADIGDAQQKCEALIDGMKDQLVQQVGTMEQTLKTVERESDEIKDKVRNDAKLLRNRMYACKLVLGKHAPQPDDADETFPELSECNVESASIKSTRQTESDEGKKAADQPEESHKKQQETLAAESKDEGKEKEEDNDKNKDKGEQGKKVGEGDADEAIEVVKEKESGDQQDTSVQANGADAKPEGDAAAASSDLAAAPAASPKAAEPIAKVPASSVKKPGTTVSNFVTSSGSYKRALIQYIASFKVDPVTGANLSAPLGANNEGTVPPCRNYQNLILIDEFKEYIPKYDFAASKEDLANLSKEYATFKEAVTDLISMCKSAVTRLQNKVKAAHSAKAKAQAGKATAKRRAGAAQAESAGKKRQVVGKAPLDEFAHQVVEPLPNYALNSKGEMDVEMDATKPGIVRVDPTHELTNNSSTLGKSSIAYGKSFLKEPAREDPGRMQQKLEGPGLEAGKNFLKQIAPGNIPTCAKDVSLFAICKDRVTVTAEVGHQGSMRLTTSGSRYVVVAQTMTVVQHLKNEDSKLKVTMKAVYDWLKGCTEEQLKSLQQQAKDKIYGGTCGPGDVLVTPAGWTFYEKVAGQDVVGIKGGFLVGAHFQVCEAGTLMKSFVAFKTKPVNSFFISFPSGVC